MVLKNWQQWEMQTEKESGDKCEGETKGYRREGFCDGTVLRLDHGTVLCLDHGDAQTYTRDKPSWWIVSISIPGCVIVL